MNFPLSPTIRSLLLKGVPMLCGSTGVSIGGWWFYESTQPTVGSILAGKKLVNISDLNVDESNYSYYLDDYKRDIASKDNSCYSRYFKSKFNISIDALDEPSSEPTNGSKDKLKDLNLNQYDSGCAIFGQQWAEMVLWKSDSSQAALFYFFAYTDLEVLGFYTENKETVKSSDYIYVLEDVDDLDFYYEGRKLMNSDWILEEGKDIKITITVADLEQSKAKVELEGRGWKNRDEYCNEIKNSLAKDYVIKKAENWCIAK